MNCLGKGLLALCLAFVVVSLGAAQSVRTKGTTVVVNETPTITFKVGSMGLSAVERADVVARNVEGIGQVVDMRVKQVGDGLQIWVNGLPLVSVTKADAAKAGVSLSGLAQQWYGKLHAALFLPPLQLSANRVVLPTGWSKTVTMVGSLAATAQIHVDRSSVAEVSRNGSAILIRAVETGTALVTVDGGASTQYVQVEVRPFAATFPQAISATVVGSPALASTVDGAVSSALKHSLVGVTGVKWSFKAPPVPAVPYGVAKTIPVKVSATGPGAYPNAGTVNVVVRNLRMPRVDDAELWYSNNPESVRSPQCLFMARLKGNRSVRMLYHHMNAASQAMYFRVEVVNDSDTPARVAIIPGDSTPNRNPVVAGAKAGEQYVRAWLYGSAEVVTVPPQSTIPISLRRVSPLETISGLCSLRMIDGPSDLMVRTDAYPPFNVDGAWQAAMYSSTPWRETGPSKVNDYDLAQHELSPHIYPDPQQPTQTWTYRVGGRHQYVRIGEKAIERQDGTGILDGNFGVFYTIKAAIENPTAETAIVDLQYIPSAGYVTGLFVMNGDLVKSPLLAPSQTWRLARMKLAPGQKKEVRIITIPLSGSSYPATLQIGATGQVSVSEGTGLH